MMYSWKPESYALEQFIAQIHTEDPRLKPIKEASTKLRTLGLILHGYEYRLRNSLCMDFLHEPIFQQVHSSYLLVREAFVAEALEFSQGVKLPWNLIQTDLEAVEKYANSMTGHDPVNPSRGVHPPRERKGKDECSTCRPFHLVHVHSHLELTRRLLNCWLVSHTPHWPLHQAAASGHVDTVRHLLTQLSNHGLRTDVPDMDSGVTPLHLAAFGGHLSIAKNLLFRGADLDVIDDFGNTPLMMAVLMNHSELVEFLLQYRANPNMASDDGDFPLDVALMRNNTRMMRALVDAGAVFTPTLPLL